MTSFKYHSTDNGNCRAYFKNTDKTDKQLYCLQSGIGDNYDLFVCTKSGEPEYPAPLEGKVFPFAEGNDKTDKSINAFIIKRMENKIDQFAADNSSHKNHQTTPG